MIRISWISFILFVLCGQIDAASVLLINDSPYELTAIVSAADGRNLGKVTLHPGEQNSWSTSYDRTDLEDVFDASSSTTPFSVVWECPYQGYYSVCTNVSPGATVVASTCDGAKTCQPKPKKEKCVPCCPPSTEKENQ